MFDNNPGLTVSASFPSDWQTVSHALDLVENFVETSQHCTGLREKLAIIVEELVANLVEFGHCPADQSIDIRIEQRGDDVQLVMSDAGVFFDPRLVKRPDGLPPARGGGTGIALILSWSRDVSYELRGGRNVLELIIPGDG